jgi:RNA polymerase sigma factor (sigma-70 family)
VSDFTIQDDPRSEGVTAISDEALAEQFEAARPRLVAMAYRLLGSRQDAEDAVQEAWFRLSRSDASHIDNPAAWLSTVVGRICLDTLRSRRRRAPGSAPAGDGGRLEATGGAPDVEAITAESVGRAMERMMDTLDPDERLALVLHDVFAVPFDEIAVILSRSAESTRQLASRARRRSRAAAAEMADQNGLAHSGHHGDWDQRSSKPNLVSAFLAAARNGEFSDLIELLHPEVMMRADEIAVEMAAARANKGAPSLARSITGRDRVAEVFVGRARAAQLSLVDGEPGAVVRVGPRIVAVFVFEMDESHILSIEIISAPERIASLELRRSGRSDGPI